MCRACASLVLRILLLGGVFLIPLSTTARAAPVEVDDGGARPAGPAAAAEEIPRALRRVLGALPVDADMALYVDLGGEIVAGLLRGLPLANAYREVFAERCVEIEKRTGLNPLEDLGGLSLAASVSQPGPLPAFLGFLELRCDVSRLARALASDPGLSKHITFDAPLRARLKQASILFLQGGVFFGPGWLIDKLEEGAGTNLSRLLSLDAALTVSGQKGFLFVTRKLPLAHRYPPTGPAALLQHVQSLAVGLNAREWGLRAVMRTNQGAEGAARMLKGLVASVLAGLEQRARAQENDDPSLAQLLSPRSIGARATYRAVQDLAEALTIDASNGTLKLQLARAGLPDLGSSISIPAVGALAAIAVPNFRRARRRASFRACYANQKTLAGAIEMYNLDYNLNVQKLDRALLEKLVSDGYLQSIPDDPGQGEGSWANYYLTETTNGIACKAHGDILGSIRGSEGGLQDRDDPTGPAPATTPSELFRSLLSGGWPDGPSPGGKAPPLFTPPLSEEKQCFANQKTLMAAIELYNLDNNVEVTKLDSGLMKTLVEQGYLQAALEDPGAGPGSGFHYYLVTLEGDSFPIVACTKHGDIQGRLKKDGR